MRNGWHSVDSEGTQVRYMDGEPIAIRTKRRDLDAAVDAAAQFVGEPLEHGEWRGATVGNELVGEVTADCHRSALDLEDA
jgi:hypothetical protein